MKLNPEALAMASSRHPRRTVGIWFAVLVAGIASAATLLGPALTTDFDFTRIARRRFPTARNAFPSRRFASESRRVVVLRRANR